MRSLSFFHDPKTAGSIFLRLEICSAIVVEPDIVTTIRDGSGAFSSSSRFRDRIDAIWLPRGKYLVRVELHCAMDDKLQVSASGSIRHQGCRLLRFDGSLFSAEASELEMDAVKSLANGASIIALPGTFPIGQMSWQKGLGDWFHRHFDHAARTIGSYILGDSEQLRGDVLDVGCGDGITDLGFALHYGPRLMVGLDPFRGFARLPHILEQNGVPRDAVPPSLRFVGHDGNQLPFPDDSFDVVISWGSLEHIAGGYRQCLREVKRVLRDGGLFFVNPGLFFSNVGHHLGEFSSEPFFHLKMSEAELRDKVLNGSPERVDRSGLEATPAEYWQWYKELNPITVTEFERELRAHDFEPWRVALRTESIIEYTPELLKYPIQDLATTELYMSCRNRKLSRPPDYAQRPPDAFASELAP